MIDVFRHGQRLPRVADFQAGRPVLVSACLVGMQTRYDGTDGLNAELVGRLSGANWLPVCPEELGGLPTPRPPADMVGGDGHDVLAGRARVIDINGQDVTAAFVEGARRVLATAQRLGVQVCYLKARSPSCGLTPCWTTAGHRRGIGVCAALLAENGIEIIEID